MQILAIRYGYAIPEDPSASFATFFAISPAFSAELLLTLKPQKPILRSACYPRPPT
jgi:hypothetical protein